MKNKRSPRLITNSLSGYLFVISLIFSSSVSNAQAPSDFSGVWIQDTIKSDDFYKSFEVKYIITKLLSHLRSNRS
jgi:hypothetical protein